MRRRVLVIGALALAAAGGPARAADYSYRGWRFDGSRVGAVSAELDASFRAQIDIVESLAIKPEIKAFFRSVPTVLEPSTPEGPGEYSFDLHRMILSMHPQPPENPVFLHELLHAYHDQRLPQGVKNPDVLRFYEAAVRSRDFPPNAYMLSRPLEFFAMCASVVLWGRAARPPYLRANVRQKLPRMYAWIVGEFGLGDTAG